MKVKICPICGGTTMAMGNQRLYWNPKNGSIELGATELYYECGDCRKEIIPLVTPQEKR